MTEDQISKMNVSKMSRLILEGISPRLNRLRESRIIELKNHWRQGTYTETKMAAIAAQLVAYDDLEKSLESEIKQGERVAQEVFNGK